MKNSIKQSVFNRATRSSFAMFTALSLFTAPLATSAHTGREPITGFVSGIVHVLSGVDHLLILFGIGLVVVALIVGVVYWRQN